MTCKELINNLQYSSGVKLNLPLWEKEFILTRAKEENLNEKEMNILKTCIHNDMFVFSDKNIIYNLLTGEAYNIHDICKKYNINIYTLKYKIKEKKCINGIPFSFDCDDLPLLYKINAETLYYCKELNISRMSSCWRKYFNDDKMNLSSLIKGKTYKGKFHFSKKDIYLVEVI